jgi:dolichol-phosphate mannosyltransferase
MARRPPQVHPFLLTAALLGLGTSLFCTRLGSALLEPEETRYAEIPRQMLRQGRFVEPVWHGAPYYHKPPLLYWLVMGSYRLFGVHDWAARLPSALAAVATVLVIFAWGTRAAGPWAGFLGGLILCLSPRFVYQARMLTLDGLLTLWVTAALATAHLATARRTLRWRWWLLSALACGLGLLTKGPVALALIAPPVVLYRALDRQAARFRPAAWLAYLAVAAGVAGPWYLAVAAFDPGAAAAFFWQHNVQRYVAPLDHTRPFWFYLPGLVLGTLPWSLLLVPLTRLLWQCPPEGRAPPMTHVGFCLLAALWSLLFFSASGCKRAGYILPCLPPLALALGSFLAQTLSWVAVCERPQGAPGARFGWGQAALFTAILLGVGGSVAAVLTGIWPTAAGVLTAGLLGVCGLAVLVRGPRLALPAAWGLSALTMLGLLLVAITQIDPGYHRKFGLRGQVRRHRDLAANGRLPVLCYPHRWDSVSFYLQRDDVRAYDPPHRAEMVAELQARPEALVFVKSDHSLRELVRALPPSLEFVPRGRSGSVVTAGVVRQRLGRPVSHQACQGSAASAPPIPAAVSLATKHQ